MFQFIFCAIVLFSSITDSRDVVPAFRDSILTGNITSAVDLISEDAILMVDSVINNDPEQISRIISYFGLQIDIPDIEDMDGRQLLSEILGNPAISAAVMIFGFVPSDPVEFEDRLFVPVEYGVFGEKYTVYIEIVSEHESWKIRDFFEILPE